MLDEEILTVSEIAERLKVDEKTVRRMFEHEPGVVILCFARRGRRRYRTIRVPESVLNRVLGRYTTVG